MKKLGILVLAGIFLLACTNDTEKQASAEKETIEEVPEKTAPVNEDPVMVEGKTNYQKHCLTCHMIDGYGVPNLNPPLAETKWVTGDEDTLINIVLNGRTGEIEVLGEIYSQVMPPHSHLSDSELASILTYIRGSFGNKSGPISEQQVANVRAKQ